MAQLVNPHKKFLYSIALFGMNPFRAQKVTLPDRDIDVIEHGEGNHVIKTAGMVKLGVLKIDTIFSASLSNTLFWNWINIVQNEITGSGSIPDIYKKACTVQLLKLDGISVADTFTYGGVWPSKINGIELDRVSSDNTIETIEFQVDEELKL